MEGNLLDRTKNFIRKIPAIRNRPEITKTFVDKVRCWDKEKKKRFAVDRCGGLKCTRTFMTTSRAAIDVRRPGNLSLIELR